MKIIFLYFYKKENTDLLNYKDLSVSEKIILVEEIWDSIAEDNTRLTKEHKGLLDDRLDSYEKNPKRTTWEQIKKNVRAKKGK